MTIPSHFDGIGYRQIKPTIALEVISVPVPKPGPDEVLIHVHGSSLNGLDHKLPLIDVFHRPPPVNVNLVTYTADPAFHDSKTNARMQGGLLAARALADAGQVKPHIGKIIRGDVAALDAELTAMKEGRSAPGKTVVKLLD